MAEETTVQIKQEPLEELYAAEINDYYADAATTSSNRSTNGSIIGDGSGMYDISGIGGDAPTNVTIKVEPNIFTCSEGREDAGNAFIAQEILGEAASLMMNGVQVKAEPEDDYFYGIDGFVNSDQHCQSIRGQSLLHSMAADFQVVDEHENIITVNAADLSPPTYELAFIQKLEELKANIHPNPYRKSRKCLICRLCMKRCFQDMHYAHHMSQHKRNRIFCLRKTCDTWFDSLEDCERHEFQVHEMKHLKCNVCNHKFHNFDQLSEHKIKMHGKLNRFVCSLCRNWFISVAELQEHWSSLLDSCGRLSCIQNETPEQILSLLKQKEQTERPNSYKIKCVSNGLKLRLKPALQDTNAYSNALKEDKSIEIKQEPIDYESILPDFPLMVNNTKSVDSYEIAQSTPAYSTNDLTVPPVKLRLRKQPLDTAAPAGDSEISASLLKKQVNKNILGQALAQRITSKFSLKTVPKMFHLTNKVNAQSTLPQIFSQSPLKRTWNDLAAAETVPSKHESPTKMLKLPSNLKVIKMLPITQPHFVQMLKASSVTPNVSLPEATINNTERAEKNEEQLEKELALAQCRHFTLQKVEVPSLDKSVVAAKIESVTKTNTELSLTELLNEAIVREVTLTDKALEAKVLDKESVQIKAEEIKKELDEEIIALKHNYSLPINNFSDTSTGSSSNATTQNTISDDGNLDLPKRPHSPHITRNNCRSKPNPTAEGYVCPKCCRRYSTSSMVREHMRSNCGRNPQHQCDVCHKCFFSASTLNCHRTIHTGVLPHKCHYCDKRFRTRGQVTVHHRTHTGERPFVCEICSQSFTHRETLISHLSRHIGMKRYKCYGCDKQFSCISGLSMHRATRPDTCGKHELNTRAIGPRVRVIRGRVVFEPQPADGDDENNSGEVNASENTTITDVLTEIQNK